MVKLAILFFKFYKEGDRRENFRERRPPTPFDIFYTYRT